MNLKMVFFPSSYLAKRFREGVGVDGEGGRRRKVVDLICLGTHSRWLGLRPEEEMSSGEQEGTVSWAVEESGRNTAGLRVAQSEDNLSPFHVNVYVVDLILDKLSWNRS
ncbi:hypothetical protein llap_8649 [Limosa lapponica baueri]|uniref:Uncharacterized protein n=1 Tax=Limosa lapponica baueri TaxID=1758121 RepID=A0A2I0U4N8_LIMLA|nr:hypothetical protein llap_8649 [Limosa lapponica baueri]